MDGTKIAKFITLSGRKTSPKLTLGSDQDRALGAQLLLSELLEYVIKGLGVTPVINGVEVTDPEAITYKPTNDPDPEEMLDGLADVAYTMWWNAETFGIPLQRAFELVCDNNLEKFVMLSNWKRGEITLSEEEWGCGKEVSWPKEVVRVQAVKVGSEYYAVGFDQRGKVRKPSTYTSVELGRLLEL